MVFALVGYVGLSSLQAATSNANGPGSLEVNLFGENWAHNSATDILNQDQDKPREFHIGDGERWSPYPPYYRSEF